MAPSSTVNFCPHSSLFDSLAFLRWSTLMKVLKLHFSWLYTAGDAHPVAVQCWLCSDGPRGKGSLLWAHCPHRVSLQDPERSEHTAVPTSPSPPDVTFHCKPKQCLSELQQSSENTNSWSWQLQLLLKNIFLEKSQSTAMRNLCTCSCSGFTLWWVLVAQISLGASSQVISLYPQNSLEEFLQVLPHLDLLLLTVLP